MEMLPWRATTILAVRRNSKVAVAGDGQVTVGEAKLKRKANKIRRLAEGKVLAGFAGAAADAFTLFERFEAQTGTIPRQPGPGRGGVGQGLAHRRMLRRLEALLIVADAERSLVISGSGEVIEPDDDAIAIGSGGSYALAAARALLGHSALTAAEIAREALRIASDICIYTNAEIVVEEL